MQAENAQYWARSWRIRGSKEIRSTGEQRRAGGGGGGVYVKVGSQRRVVTGVAGSINTLLHEDGGLHGGRSGTTTIERTSMRSRGGLARGGGGGGEERRKSSRGWVRSEMIITMGARRRKRTAGKQEGGRGAAMPYLGQEQRAGLGSAPAVLV
jgi:hypothetical protein